MFLSAIRRYEQQVFTALAVSLWLVIIVLSLLPGDERPHTGASGNVEHLMAYVGTGCITALAFRAVPALWLVLPFCLASALFEIAQIFIPGRSSGLDNWFFSTVGALVGILAARHVIRPWLDRAGGPPHPRPDGERG